MKNSLQLKEERAELRKQLDALDASAKAEKRELNADETTKWETLYNQIRGMEAEILRAEKREALEAEETQKRGQKVGTGGEEKEKNEIKRRFSISRMIATASRGKDLDGLEAEVNQAAQEEARTSGVTLAGVGLPSWMLRVHDPNTEQRTTMSVGGSNVGSHFVPTDLSNEVIEYLYPRAKVIGLGARVLTGLSGNFDIPKISSTTSGTWEGETDANAESNLGTTKLSMTPKRLGTFVPYSKQLVLQSNPSVDAMIRMDLSKAIENALDVAAINGSGSGGQPTGLLGLSTTINSVVMGTNGAVPTFATMVEMESLISADNADVATMAYLTTPGIRGYLKTKEKATNTAQFVWENGNTVNGYNAVVSTQVPSTLTKGSASGVCHAILFGDWSQLYIGQWGGVDLVIDPYTSAQTAVVNIVINTWWDIKVRHEAAFCYVKDALIA